MPRCLVPAPNEERGARSKANLKKGGSPGRRKVTAETKAVKRLAVRLLNDPVYLKNLKERLQTGRLQPGVETLLYYYAHGKPTEIIETKQITPLRLVHEYATEKPEDKAK